MFVEMMCYLSNSALGCLNFDPFHCGCVLRFTSLFIPPRFLVPYRYRRSYNLNIASHSANSFLVALSFWENGTTIEKYASNRLPSQRKPCLIRNYSLEAYRLRGQICSYAICREPAFSPLVYAPYRPVGELYTDLTVDECI